jgi:oxidase EvaA
MEKLQITSDHIEQSINTINSPSSLFEDLSIYFQELKNNSKASTDFVGLKDLDLWNFDLNGNFSHKSGKFFKVSGIDYENINSGILLQPEIGTLGLICTLIDGILHFLIQFKGEPGSVDYFQLSPTIQATKSNYSKVHGGALPPYWEEFSELPREQIVYEGILSEQGTRYFQKYSRNVITYSEDILNEIDNFKWMTLGQLYEFNNIDNSINSCLRSVLSLLNPQMNLKQDILKNENLRYLLNDNKDNYKVESKIQDNIKNFYNEKDDLIEFKTDLDDFSIRGLQVNIKGREVSSWYQPIVVEEKTFDYYLFRVIINNKVNYLWRITKEPGYSFGFMYGPTILDTSYLKNKNDLEKIKKEFANIAKVSLNKVFTMSEEGGRFWKSIARHHIYDVLLDSKEELPQEFSIFDEYETYKLLESGFLSIEARSLLYFANSLRTAG